MNSTPIESLRNGLLATTCYLDTLIIWFERRPDRDRLRALSEFCGTLIPGQDKTKEGLLRTCCRKGKVYRFRMIIHQPSSRAIRLLHEMTGTMACLISRIDVALDFCYATKAQAEFSTRFIQQHIVKHRRGQEKVGMSREGKAFYSRERKGRGVNVVVYPRSGDLDYKGKPMLSKYKAMPCAHVEFRVTGFRRVRESLGIHQPEDLLKQEKCNLRLFCRRRFVLEEVLWYMLGRQYRRQPRAKKPPIGYYGCPDPDVRAGHLLVRANVMEEQGCTTLMVKDWLRTQQWCRVAGCFRSLNGASLLDRLDIYMADERFPPPSPLSLPRIKCPMSR